MYNCTIKITPNNSSCVDRIEWNSEAKTMCIFYTDNDQCYDYTDIEWNDILDLESKALVQQSWGRALNMWKKEREVKFAMQAKANFDGMWGRLHNSDKRNYVRWSSEAYTNELVTKRSAKR